MQQLETNAKEMDTVNEELGLIETSESENYESFTTSLNNKRRTQSEQQASDVLKNAKTIDEAKKEASEKEEIEKAKQAAAQSDGKKIFSNILSKIAPNIEITLTSKTQTTTNDLTTNPNKNSTVTKKPSALESILPDTVDEFNRFLDDSKVNENITKIQLNNSTDSDEDDNKNPMVLNYSENIDLSDDESANGGKKFKPVILNPNSSDDETKKSYSIKPIEKSPNSDKQFLNRNKIEVNFIHLIKLKSFLN